VLKIFLKNVIRDAVTYMEVEHAHSKTVTAKDIVYALTQAPRPHPLRLWRLSLPLSTSSNHVVVVRS
jgi:hypothetical protein